MIWFLDLGKLNVFFSFSLCRGEGHPSSTATKKVNSSTGHADGIDLKTRMEKTPAILF